MGVVPRGRQLWGPCHKAGRQRPTGHRQRPNRCAARGQGAHRHQQPTDRVLRHEHSPLRDPQCPRRRDGCTRRQHNHRPTWRRRQRLTLLPLLWRWRRQLPAHVWPSATHQRGAWRHLLLLLRRGWWRLLAQVKYHLIKPRCARASLRNRPQVHCPLLLLLLGLPSCCCCSSYSCCQSSRSPPTGWTLQGAHARGLASRWQGPSTHWQLLQLQPVAARGARQQWC